MEKIKVIHDQEGQTLTIWFDDPAKEFVCEETADEVILMKDATRKIIGFEMLNYQPSHNQSIEGLMVETLIHPAPSL
jgi:hypothetical protein